MLLAEFVGRAHVQLDDDRQQPVDLHQVRAFVFGESYLISLNNGKSYDVRELEDILSVLHDEFQLWHEQWIPGLQISQLPGVKGLNGQKRVLEVTAVERGVFLPPLPVMHTIERVRLAVTMFNLTGSWDQFSKGNL
jgi:hypothetical protein